MNNIEPLLRKYSCDLCGRLDEEFIKIKRGTITDYPFRVIRCRSCGLIYINPRLDEQSISRLYDKNYYDGKGFDDYVRYIEDFYHGNDANKRFRPEKTVEFIRKLVPPPSTLLDFGCGLGDFIRQSIKHGYEAQGYEVSGFAVDFARGNGLTVFDKLEDVPINYYDIVTCIEVLEHCSFPTDCLSAIYKFLKPGGIFYYTTANFDYWHEDYINPEGHIHFFSTRTMKLYFKKIGFSEIFYPKIYYNGPFYKLLYLLGLANSKGAPTSAMEKLIYFGILKIATIIGLRKRPLPLARK